MRCWLSIAVLACELASAQSLFMDQREFVVGERIAVRYQGAAMPTDAIAIGYEGASVSGKATARAWRELAEVRPESAGEGRVVFAPFGLPPGRYAAQWMRRDVLAPLATVNFEVRDGAVAPKLVEPRPDLVVMSFNIWVQGSKGPGGLDRVIEEIARSQADLIGLQEANAETVRAIAQGLRKRDGYGALVASEGVAVLSRYPIEAEDLVPELRGYGVRVRLPGDRRVRFINSHFKAYPYGPYELRDGRSAAEVLEIERTTRDVEARAVIESIVDHRERAPEWPTFWVGDHNTPSHLDWTEANREQNFGHALDWPVSRRIEDAGFRDLFRIAHPDPVKIRGFTWSPGYPKGEWAKDDVHDRIDMIYFRPGQGADVVVQDAWTLAADPWPSDHRAVAASIRWRR